MEDTNKCIICGSNKLIMRPHKTFMILSYTYKDDEINYVCINCYSELISIESKYSKELCELEEIIYGKSVLLYVRKVG